MSLDEYYTLGRSGLRVSRLALGTMTFASAHAGAARAELGREPSERRERHHRRHDDGAARGQSDGARLRGAG